MLIISNEGFGIQNVPKDGFVKTEVIRGNLSCPGLIDLFRLSTPIPFFM